MSSPSPTSTTAVTTPIPPIVAIYWDIFTYVIMGLAFVAGILHIHVIRTFNKERSKLSPFNLLCFYRSFMHVVSSIFIFFFTIFGRYRDPTHKRVTSITIDTITLHLSTYDVVFALNGLVAIAYWNYYDIIFSSFLCLIYSYGTLPFEAFWDIAYWYIVPLEYRGIVSQSQIYYGEALSVIALLIHCVTFAKLIRFKMRIQATTVSNRLMVKKNVVNFGISVCQLLLTLFTYVPLITSDPIEDRYYCMVYYFSFNIVKDLLEGVMMTVSFQKGSSAVTTSSSNKQRGHTFMVAK